MYVFADYYNSSGGLIAHIRIQDFDKEYPHIASAFDESTDISKVTLQDRSGYYVTYTIVSRG